MKNNTFTTVCPYCGTPVCCDKELLNKHIQCGYCNKPYRAVEKEYVYDKRQKILDQIIKKSELVGEWKNFLSHINDRSNPHIPKWQETLIELESQRKELYDKLLNMIKEKFKD